MLDSYNAILLNKTTFFATFAMLITSFHCMTLCFVKKRWILSRSTQDIFLDRYFSRILFLELMIAILRNDKFKKQLYL